MIIQRALTLELASRGHEVTVVSPFPEAKPVPNYTEIMVEIDLASMSGGNGKKLKCLLPAIFTFLVGLNVNLLQMNVQNVTERTVDISSTLGGGGLLQFEDKES
jgi:hypothetical protein